ncbi:hypothetical protein [Microbacterium sp. CFBP9034]|uniref:hypothetical protein n=1 Tax=Microbacterium sp. CFBP9034 TaxID=3096540 RepID=UPI002A69AA60|nr:hypothetical protein [Microbacterium sp. CFBP9034]MDY0910111.1 hypothetical protein [Microbacterium sp. CFBP9034]
MTPTLVSALMWALVAVLLILRRGRADRSITYSAVTIAIAMTLNIDPVYIWVDDLLGGTNVATLLADLALMVGIFFLGRGVAKASRAKPGTVRIALGWTLLAIALTGAAASFLLIDRGSTTTTFMLDLGAQPAAAGYSIIQFVYDGVILTAMAAIAARQIGESRAADRLPAVALLTGSLSGLALSIVIIAMDLAHVAGNLELMFGLSAAYDPLFLTTFVFLCLGLAGQPALRWGRAQTRARATRALVDRVTPIWDRASRVRPGLSQYGAGIAAEDDETQLHRQVVEIRDAVIDPRVTFELSDDERVLVDEAEAHLIGRGAGSRGGEVSARPGRPGRAQ